MIRLFFLLFVFLSAAIPAGAHPAWGIEVDRHRNVYFADVSHNGLGTVWKLTRDGELTALFTNFHAHNVNLDKDGLPVAGHSEEGENILVRLLADGKRSTIFEAEHHTKFFGGNSFYSKRGNIYFGLKNIWRVDDKGKAVKFNDHDFEWIQSMYVDDEEHAYAVDKAAKEGSLYRLSNDGKVDVLATGLITKTKQPVDIHNIVLSGITKGCDGFMYVTESVGRRVVKINEDGTHSTFYESAEGWFPTGIDFFAGDAYVLEHETSGSEKGPRITRIDESGRVETIFEYGSAETRSAYLERQFEMFPWRLILPSLPVGHSHAQNSSTTFPKLSFDSRYS